MKKIMIFFLSILSLALCACSPGKPKNLEQESHRTALIADHELKSLADELDAMEAFKTKRPSKNKNAPLKQIYFPNVPIDQIKMAGLFSLQGRSTAFLVYNDQYQTVRIGDYVSNDSIRVETIEPSRVVLSAYPDQFVISLDKNRKKANEPQ